jgi:hypothetical protein
MLNSVRALKIEAKCFQCGYLENATAFSKRTLKTHVATHLNEKGCDTMIFYMACYDTRVKMAKFNL